MKKTLALMFAVLCALPVAALAQTPAAPPADPISTSEARMYGMLSGMLVAAAEKMPEENYSFKPSPDVRTFGQLVGHLSDAQFYFCSSVAGEKNPAIGAEKTKTAKADLIAALKDANA